MEAPRAGRAGGLRILAWLVVAAYLAQLAWLAATAFDPTLRDQAPAWAATLSAPGSILAMGVTVALSSAAFVLVLVSARTHSNARRVPLLISAWAAASAAPLAFAGYLPCPGDGPPVWDAISSTLSLFFGSFEKPFGPGQSCSYPAPIGVHIARQFALLATASGATSVLLTVSRSQLDRLAVLRARQLSLVVGVDGPSWELVERLATPRRPRHRTVLLTAEADPAVVDRARAAGLAVVRTDPDDLLGTAEGVRSAKIDRVWLLSGDDALNRARAQHLLQLLPTLPRAADAGPLALVARIDDPWHADEWRKELVGDPLVAADAVGLYEATSSSLIALLRHGPPRRLLIAGDGPLTLALCAQLSQLGRELQFLGEAGALPAVTVLCGRASELVEDHRVLQRRFAFDPLTVTAVDAEPALAIVLDLLGDAGDMAVVITERDTRLGTQLAIRQPTLRVYELGGSSEVATPDTPTVGSLISFGLSLSGPAGADDAWERTARLIHERYRRRYPDAALAVAWSELPEFYRQSNRRQLAVVRRELARLGRTWSPTSPEAARIDQDRIESGDADAVIEEGLVLFDLTAGELGQVARAEHESWLRHYREAGWVAAPVRDNAARHHPDLVEWDELPPGRRRSAMAGVVDTLLQLRALGYRAVRPVTAGPPQWGRFDRIGTVRAGRLTEPHRWRTASGEELVGQPGDWLVTDDAGGTRTVTDASFHATHRQLDGDRWQRAGQVEARPVRPGEVVDTQEGATTAGESGWLVRDADDNRWIVPEEQFRSGYRAADQPVGFTAADRASARG